MREWSVMLEDDQAWRVRAIVQATNARDAFVKGVRAARESTDGTRLSDMIVRVEIVRT
jgi:hypothetical protein